MAIRLNTADPTMVPVPISLSEMNTPIIEVNNSGAEVPMAINVAPAISDGISRAVKKKWEWGKSDYEKKRNEYII